MCKTRHFAFIYLGVCFYVQKALNNMTKLESKYVHTLNISHVMEKQNNQISFSYAEWPLLSYMVWERTLTRKTYLECNCLSPFCRSTLKSMELPLSEFTTEKILWIKFGTCNRSFSLKWNIQVRCLIYKRCTWLKLMSNWL